MTLTSKDVEQKHPKITVLIPTFNRAAYLAESLDSILVQTLPPAQLIVVDDGSTDDTRSVCDAYRSKIEYLQLNQLGKSSAINYGLKKASGDYIWIFDDDDVAFPDALKRFVEPLENGPEFGFSYSTFFYTANDEKTNRLGRILYELKIPDLETRGFLIPLLEWNFLGGASLFARASCYKKVGDFDSELLRSQDYEMAIRLARRFRGVRVPGRPTFHYRQHEGIRGANRDRFSGAIRLQKWFNYNQKFFRKLYCQIPIAEYLPPGVSTDDKMRQALLQRITVMSYKLLIPEMVKDLRELALLPDQTPFSQEEYRIIRNMIMKSPYEDIGTILGHPEFFGEIRRLAASSTVIRLLRTKVLRALLARYRSRPRLDKLLEILYRIFHLYF